MEKRVRNFAFLIYEDSAPEDWKEKLADLLIPSFYIYHDQDTDSDGNKKKPHYHVLIMLETPHGLKNVQNIASCVGAANGSFCPVINLRSYARYLCHLDNPEKYRYQESLVVSLCGAEYDKFAFMEQDKILVVRDILIFCRDHQVYSYASLVNFCLDENQQWFRILCGYHGRIVKDYIRSIWWEANEESASRRSEKGPKTRN